MPFSGNTILGTTWHIGLAWKTLGLFIAIFALSITDAASSPATFSLFKTKAISANATTELLSQDCLVLKSSEILKAQAATANRLHVIVSIQEYYTGIG